jgi:hypothetical protein
LFSKTAINPVWELASFSFTVKSKQKESSVMDVLRTALVKLVCLAFLVGCEPYDSVYFERPLWSDDDHSIVYSVEYATNYTANLLSHYNYEVRFSDVMITTNRSVSNGVLLFSEEEAGVYPLYFSELHQLLIYYTTGPYGSHYALHVYDLASQTKRSIDADVRYGSKVSLSPNGDWFALSNDPYVDELGYRAITVTFVSTDSASDAVEIVVINSSFESIINEPTVLHWQGNDSVWLTHSGRYFVFDRLLEYVEEQFAGCVEPSMQSSEINSQGLKVSFSHREEDDLTITQKTPPRFCLSE